MYLSPDITGMMRKTHVILLQQVLDYLCKLRIKKDFQILVIGVQFIRHHKVFYKVLSEMVCGLIGVLLLVRRTIVEDMIFIGMPVVRRGVLHGIMYGLALLNQNKCVIIL